MTKLLDKAIAEARKLPPEEQDAIGAMILDEITDEKRWAKKFAETREHPTTRRTPKARTNQRTRKKELGDFGEIVAKEIIAKLGFTKVELLPKNTPFFDIQGCFGTERHIFTVKTRNKSTFKGKLKVDDYNLYVGKGETEKELKEKITNATKRFGIRLNNLSWIAVTVDTKLRKYSAYLGRVDELHSLKYIPMKPADIKNHQRAGRCVACDVFDPRISPTWSNIRR